MDGGQHRHAHAGGLLRGIGLGAAHLAHHKDVRVEAQADIHQRDLIDPLTLISLSRVRVWTTELTTLPFSSRTSSSSREPFSMVKMRLLSGIVVSSQPAAVVLPEEVAPATQMEIP